MNDLNSSSLDNSGRRIVVDPVKWVWVGCVVIDAFADFRARWASPTGKGSGGA